MLQDIRIVGDTSAAIEAARLRIARGKIGGEIVLLSEKAYERRARAKQCIHLAEDVIMVDADDGEADRHVDPAPRCDGHSFAVDPSGRIIAMADTSPGLVLATFDLGAIRKARRGERFRWQI